MNKILVLIFLMLSVNSQANSNWTYVTTNVNADEFFIDQNSIQKDGDSVTLWTRRNFANRSKDGDLSEKAQRTINCRRREDIIRYIQTYDEINNAGRQTFSFKVNESWHPIAPDTVMWSIMKIVCK